MTKNKIKNIVMIVAVILCLVIACGWIAQTAIKNKAKISEAETAGCFILTPENKENSVMTLAVSSLTATDGAQDTRDTAAAFYRGQAYTLTANVVNVIGQPEVTWSVAFIDVNSEYAEKNSVENYIELIKDDSNSSTVTVRCLQPFMEQLVITATLGSGSGATATCICDYEQRYVYGIELGKYRFRTDGVIEYADGKKISVYSAVFDADLGAENSLSYSVSEISTLYTVSSMKYKTGSANFVIEPTEEFIDAMFGYDLITYGNDSDDSGELVHFFDNVWAKTNNGNYDFAKKLAAITDNFPFYQLKITDAPCGEVVFDLYFNFTYPENIISLDKSEIKF